MASPDLPNRIRKILDDAEIDVETRRSFIGALQGSLTLGSDSFPFRLSDSESQAWAQVFNLVAEYVQAQEGASISSEEIPPLPPPPEVSESAPRKVPVRMTRREYKQLQQLVAEKRRARDEVKLLDDAPEVLEREIIQTIDSNVLDEELNVDEEKVQVPQKEEEEEEDIPAPDSVIEEGVVSESGDGFLDALTSDQIRELDASDAVVIVRRKGH
jgi:hypothetical protein